MNHWTQRAVQAFFEVNARSRSERTYDFLIKRMKKAGINHPFSVRLIEGRIYKDLDECYECYECGNPKRKVYPWMDGPIPMLYSPGKSRLVCKRCSEKYGFLCGHTSRHYSSSNYTSVTVYETRAVVCLQVCMENQSIHQWADGTFHNRREEDCVRDPRMAYHRSNRNWVIIDKDDHIGAELEVCSIDIKNRASLCSTAIRLGLIAERDGSLDDRLGVEIVGPPLVLSKYRKSMWERMMLEVFSTTQDADDGYGMHVSVSRRHLSIADQAKFLAWFPKNRTRCEALARRSSERWAKFVPKSFKHARYEAIEVTPTKHQAASARDSQRIEVRIFRSTRDWNQFLSNIQMVQSVADWVRVAGYRDIPVWARYKKYVLSQPNRYRELIKSIAMLGI